MTMTERIISRSGYERFSKCPRAYYYEYALDGTGFRDAEKIPWALHVGTAVHAGMEQFLTWPDQTFSPAEIEPEKPWNIGISTLTSLIPANALTVEQVPEYRESVALVGGLLSAWGLIHHSDFHDKYEILSIEKEVKVPLASNVSLAARADAVVRDRDTRMAYVINWKTSSSLANWNSKWQYAIQMWTEAVAMEQEFSPIVGVIVIGFNKGTRRNGERYSPFCRAKLHEMDKRMNFTNITGLLWKTVHPWEDLEVGEGLDISNIWMDSIPKDIMREQFAFSEPVFKNNLVVDNWLKQVVRRETDAQYVLEHGTLEDQECFFYQNFTEECKWCQYRSICTGATDMASLIRDGFMARREDHHATE